MRKPRLIFMGTPAFSAAILEALVQSDRYEIICVYTQPPRKSGRGHKIQKSPVQLCAESYDLPVESPLSLKFTADQSHFSELKADLAVVVAYGLLLPKPILDAPTHGCLNIHTSLLPRWRGAAPIQHAIWAGDQTTGVSLMKLDEGMDTGPVYTTEQIPLSPKETASSLYNRLEDLSISLLLKTLPNVLKGSLTATPQPSDGITHASKITKEMGCLDWAKSATELERQVRALSPVPGGWFTYHGERLKVYEAEVLEADKSVAAPGTLLTNTFHIACGTGIFVPKVIQKAGGKPLPIDIFLKGFPITPREQI